jgi:hypothetical protein
LAEFLEAIVWPSGLRRGIKAPISSEAQVRTLQRSNFFFVGDGTRGTALHTAAGRANVWNEEAFFFRNLCDVVARRRRCITLKFMSSTHTASEKKKLSERPSNLCSSFQTHQFCKAVCGKGEQSRSSICTSECLGPCSCSPHCTTLTHTQCMSTGAELSCGAAVCLSVHTTRRRPQLASVRTYGCVFHHSTRDENAQRCAACTRCDDAVRGGGGTGCTASGGVGAMSCVLSTWPWSWMGPQPSGRE